jgi:hypothetical protein
MENDLRRWIRLLESEQQFFHGSKRCFKVGTILKPQRGGYAFGSGYPATEKRVRMWCENYLEAGRPSSAVPRKSAVFMVDNPALIEEVGGYSDHVYTVKPIGPVTRCNLYWYSEMEGYCFHLFHDGNHPERADEYDIRRFAKGYWTAAPNDIGEPSRDSFEFLAGSAEVAAILS